MPSSPTPLAVICTWKWPFEPLLRVWMPFTKSAEIASSLLSLRFWKEACGIRIVRCRLLGFRLRHSRRTDQQLDGVEFVERKRSGAGRRGLDGERGFEVARAAERAAIAGQDGRGCGPRFQSIEEPLAQCIVQRP